MPRKFKLTWRPGSGNRPGRWKKKYKGQSHYFSGGRGKSDSDAYQAALAAWEKRKLRIDAALPKAHQAEYEQAIREWQSVLTWCRKHPGDEHMADVALTESISTIIARRYSLMLMQRNGPGRRRRIDSNLCDRLFDGCGRSMPSPPCHESWMASRRR